MNLPLRPEIFERAAEIIESGQQSFSCVAILQAAQELEDAPLHFRDVREGYWYEELYRTPDVRAPLSVQVRDEADTAELDPRDLRVMMLLFAAELAADEEGYEREET